MNKLHELIYQMTQTPHLISELYQNSQNIMDKFNLTHNEVAALKATLQYQPQALLATANIQQASKTKDKKIELVWI